MITVLSRIRKIGNSKGILFSRSILEKSGITDNVKILVKDNVIMISSAETSKTKKWSDFKKVKGEKIDLMQNKFDNAEWIW